MSVFSGFACLHRCYTPLTTTPARPPGRRSCGMAIDTVSSATSALEKAQSVTQTSLWRLRMHLMSPLCDLCSSYCKNNLKVTQTFTETSVH